ncbi:MAG: T9SS type A sorting domain-containing protein, partial [Flavobacterium sp.]
VDVWQFSNGDNTGAKFWKDLFDNPTYKCYFSRRWNELTSPDHPLKHNNLVTFIDQTVALISEASVRENQKWGTIPNMANEIENMKTWLYQRINWMTSHIGPNSACSNVVVPQLVINKINYNPAAGGSFPVSNDQEFIEIKNAGTTLADLTGVYFRELGITYQFPSSTLAAGQSVYLASNSATFLSRYGFAAFGQFTRNLSNNSQKLVLADPFGNVIDTVEYDDNSPWPDADGNGSYLQLIDTSLDNSLASSWTASTSTLSAEGFTLDKAQVYPNPVSDTLHVRLPKMINKAQIFDARGKVLKTISVHSEIIDIDFRSFPKGIYFLLISFDGGSSTQKIMKQ